MNALLLFLVEASLISGIVYVLFLAFLRNHREFQYNRFFLLCGIAFTLVLPFVSVSVNAPSYLSSLTFNLDEGLMGGEAVSPSSEFDLSNPATIIAMIYVAGVGFLVGRLLIQIIQIRKIYRQGPVVNHEGYKLLQTTGRSSIGSFMRIIFWDEELTFSKEEEIMILGHERAHVRQGHSWDVLAVEVFRIVLWFNPIAHLIRLEVKKNHEFIADSVAAGNKKGAYLKLIAQQVLVENDLLLTHKFNNSQISNRMKMLIMEKKKLPGANKIMLAASLTALMIAFSCEPVPLKEGPATLKELPTASDQVFEVVEQMPQPENGIQAFYQYVAENLRYPAQARRMAIEGRVYIGFVVNKDGSISHVKALKGIGAGCDAEAVRVVEASPNWVPGVQLGQKVNVKMVLPIEFKLNQ